MPGIKPLHTALRISTLQILWIEMLLTWRGPITNTENHQGPLCIVIHMDSTLSHFSAHLFSHPLSTSTADSSPSCHQNISWHCSSFVLDLRPFSPVESLSLWGPFPFNYYLSNPHLHHTPLQSYWASKYCISLPTKHFRDCLCVHKLSPYSYPSTPVCSSSSVYYLRKWYHHPAHYSHLKLGGIRDTSFSFSIFHAEKIQILFYLLSQNHPLLHMPASPNYHHSVLKYYSSHLTTLQPLLFPPSVNPFKSKCNHSWAPGWLSPLSIWVLISAQVMISVWEFEPHIGLCADSVEPAWDSLPLFPPLLHP